MKAEVGSGAPPPFPPEPSTSSLARQLTHYNSGSDSGWGMASHFSIQTGRPESARSLHSAAIRQLLLPLESPMFAGLRIGKKRTSSNSLHCVRHTVETEVQPVCLVQLWCGQHTGFRSTVTARPSGMTSVPWFE